MYHCAVIIPTKNAMPKFVRVLGMVRRQKTPWPFEIVIIDSGSSDGTVQFVKNQDNVRLLQIDPTSFGHGRTRNQAIAECDAKFVALLTHDAEPIDEFWLANLVGAVEQDGRIGGAFGRHIAYPEASPFTKRDLDRHFEGFLKHPLIVHRDLDREKYINDVGWRQLLHFYSDNNSCMRKSVWETIPYPDVEFAEDQIWARDIVEAGFAKAYAPDATVLHSHDYGIQEQIRRAFDESRNFEKYFGYRLSENITSALRSIVGFFLHALGDSIDQKFGKINMIDRVRYFFRKVSLVVGHYLGSRHSIIPDWAARRLSQDNKLFEQ